MMHADQSTLSTLPDEILSAILLRLSAKDLVSLQLTSKRLADLANDNYIWQHQCRATWRYWHPDHNFAHKITQPVEAVRWKELFVRRKSTDGQVARIFDSFLASQQGRIEKVEVIRDKGYDAKDLLLRYCAAPESAPDVLARRYYGEAILGSFHRKLAIEEWQRLRQGGDVPLERALGAYDMFVIGGRKGEMSDVMKELDDLTAKLLQQHPNLPTMTSRQKALTLVTYLREHSYLGIDADTPYVALKNNLISAALFEPEHHSLPLISAAIYCSIARRVGLDARPCNYPLHIFVRVVPPPDQNLDGKPVSHPTSTSSSSSTSPSPPTSEPDVMYLDPFRSTAEVSPDSLASELKNMGVPRSSYPIFLSAAPTRDIVLRSCRNMLNAIHADTVAVGHAVPPRPWTRTFPDKDGFLYAAQWALLVLERLDAGPERRTPWPMAISDVFQEHFPMDVGLLEEHTTPTLKDTPDHDRMLEQTRGIRMADSAPKPVVRRERERERDKNREKDRDAARRSEVRYRVGQMIRHKRYSYEGVITGWTPRCDADERWIIMQEVDRLPYGRLQSFYHVLSVYS